MKKWVALLLAVLTSLALGIWIGKSRYQSTSNSDNSIAEEIDTAQINFEKEMELKYPIYTEPGGLPLPDDKYRYLVSGWYGFRFRTTGSSCTDQYQKTFDAGRNKKTDSILSARISPDWHERFEKTVDSLYAIDSLACSIAENDPAIKRLIKSKTKDYKHTVYPTYKYIPTPQKHIKAVSIEWLGKIYKDNANVSFIRAAVDIRTKKVIKTEDIEMEWDKYR